MLTQGLQQKLLQKLSPQQIQLMKLLQVPTAALEQRIKEELQNNPALEEGNEEDEYEEKNDEEDIKDEPGDSNEESGNDEIEREEFDFDEYIQDDEIPSYKLSVNNSGADDDRVEIPLTGGNSFQDLLTAQLGLSGLEEKKHLIASHIIGSLDDDGYLRRPLKALADDLSFSQNIHTTEKELEDVLHVIQTFDPPGIGARDLRECLLLQLKRKEGKSKAATFAYKIISEYMEEFSKKHYDKIEKQLGITEEELKEALHEILKLNPRPGDTYSDSQKSVQHIIPDFTLTNNDGILELSLNTRNAPELKISRSYKEMIASYAKDKKNKNNKEAAQFARQKIDAAKWFIDAIQQRQHTLMATMSAILEFQQEYFQEGDETKMKPMILKDIADKVGLDISTISRVANSKYIQTHFGTFPLKSFFSEGLQTDSGEEVSSREVKKILSDCISGENKKKPLTDDRLAKILREKGYNIARRTVAKYREQLEIPVARMRKEL